jgi:hypothetical protein
MNEVAALSLQRWGEGRARSRQPQCSPARCPPPQAVEAAEQLPGQALGERRGPARSGEPRRRPVSWPGPGILLQGLPPERAGVGSGARRSGSRHGRGAPRRHFAQACLATRLVRAERALPPRSGGLGRRRAHPRSLRRGEGRQATPLCAQVDRSSSTTTATRAATARPVSTTFAQEIGFSPSRQPSSCPCTTTRYSLRP